MFKFKIELTLVVFSFDVKSLALVVEIQQAFLWFLVAVDIQDVQQHDSRLKTFSKSFPHPD